MRKFITLLMGCSVALAVGAHAAQKKETKKPVKKPPHAAAGHPQAMSHPGAQAGHAQHAPTHNQARVHNPNVTQPHLNPQAKAHPNKMPNVQSNTLPAVQSNRLPAVQSNKLPAMGSNKLPHVQPNAAAVQNIRAQHVDFRARPSTTINSAQFNQSYRIHGAENWRGAHYDVFRSYHPQWHDSGWWHAHHNHLLLIGGGWYFWNAGYWCPAWGYDTAAAYYPYDGPIYVGAAAKPADQVIADVQSVLQEQGYYHGEVDGLLGPLTRDALASYQGAQGLEPTAAIDQPTLASLGLG